MPWYKLGARFWDGAQVHNRGDVIHLLKEIDPPPLSKEVADPNAKAQKTEEVKPVAKAAEKKG